VKPNNRVGPTAAVEVVIMFTSSLVIWPLYSGRQAETATSDTLYSWEKTRDMKRGMIFYLLFVSML